MAERPSTARDAACPSLLARSARDADAFAAFYERYVQRVSVYFMRRVLDPDVAFDLTGETFALALERRRQFRGDSEQEEQGWLFAIARSQLRLYWRRGSVEREALARLRIERPSLGTEDIEFLYRVAGIEALRDRLAQALRAVRPDQAAAIRARVIEERGYAEIAADFDTTPDVIRARVSRGLRTMEALLGNQVEDMLADA